MIFDMHTHNARCGHATGCIRDYIEAAIVGGLSVIGISDHAPYFAQQAEQPAPAIAMAKSQFTGYISEVLELRAEYKDQIEVLLGVESDFYPKHADVYRAIFDQYPFDYIIGSVHQTRDGLSVFNKNRWNNLNKFQQVQVKDDYYRLIAESAQSGMFQILGHIDAMKGYYPEFSAIPSKALDEALRIIGEVGVAIEVNTSGKTKDVGGWYPSDEILERAHYHGVSITFGSDAHVSSRVGDDFHLVERKLREIGYKEWIFFRQKERQVVPL
ncbi:MAG: histidinol-phosphatase [Gorillibacterium sp.]|nr:histidinol-phosphatase [Gorillibacterium sp.]